jgi:hypothetical protein
MIARLCGRRPWNRKTADHAAHPSERERQAQIDAFEPWVIDARDHVAEPARDHVAEPDQGMKRGRGAA